MNVGVVWSLGASGFEGFNRSEAYDANDILQALIDHAFRSKNFWCCVASNSFASHLWDFGGLEGHQCCLRGLPALRRHSIRKVQTTLAVTPGFILRASGLYTPIHPKVQEFGLGFSALRVWGSSVWFQYCSVDAFVQKHAYIEVCSTSLD